MGSVSRLRGGNQAKKAQRFKVSVFGSHVGPGSAMTDSFLCSFLGPPPTSSFSGVVAGTGIGLSSGLTETVDHEMDGAFVGSPPRCDPKCGQRVGEVSPDEGVVRCFENTGDDEFSSAGAGGRRTFSSSLSMKRCSSSTLSRRHARCAEAGGSLDSFESSFVCCADPVMTRVQRVTDASHGHHNACGTHLSQNSYSVHGACGVWNSENSRGDTEVGGQHFCVHGETKSLSTCTRTGVRRPAVEKLPSPQQRL